MNKKKLLSALIAAAICITPAATMATVTANAESSIEDIDIDLEEMEKHGMCGTDAHWDFEDGVLRISGYGDITVVYAVHTATPARALCHTLPLTAHGQCPAEKEPA